MAAIKGDVLAHPKVVIDKKVTTRIDSGKFIVISSFIIPDL
jgi:hypothetical protein